MNQAIHKVFDDNDEVLSMAEVQYYTCCLLNKLAWQVYNIEESYKLYKEIEVYIHSCKEFRVVKEYDDDSFLVVERILSPDNFLLKVV